MALCLPSRLPAPPETETVSPNTQSAKAVTGLFEIVTALAVWNDPTNWVIYTTAGTYIYYKNVFKSAHDFAKGTRANLLREHTKSTANRQAIESSLARIDEQIALLEAQVPKAEAAYKALDTHLRLLKKTSKGGEVPLDGMNDFVPFIHFLTSKKGEAHFARAENKEWKNTFDGLIAEMTVKVDQPLSVIVAEARKVIPQQPIDRIQSRDFTQGGHQPMDFATKGDFTHLSNPVAVGDLVSRMKNLRGQCAVVHSAATDLETQLAKDSDFRNFWMNRKNIGRPALHFVPVVVGTIGSYVTYRATNYARLKAQQEEEDRKNKEAKSDFAGWIASADGKKAMNPYYELLRRSFKENRQDLIAMLEQNLSHEEKMDLKIPEFFDSTIDAGAFLSAVESATMLIVKKKQGEDVTNESFLLMLENAKTDPSVRVGLIKALNKEIIKETVNNLWAELKVGDPSESFTIGNLRKVMNRTNELLEGDQKIKSPSTTKEIVPAPGTSPPPEKITQPKSPATEPPKTSAITLPDVSSVAVVNSGTPGAEPSFPLPPDPGPSSTQERE